MLKTSPWLAAYKASNLVSKQSHERRSAKTRRTESCRKEMDMEGRRTNGKRQDVRTSAIPKETAKHPPWGSNPRPQG